MRQTPWLATLFDRWTSTARRTAALRRYRQSSPAAILEVLESRRVLSGQTITVDVMGDANVAGHTTLRNAIATANGDAGGDTIVFAPNVTGVITLTQGELAITNSMTINGPGANRLTISGNNNSRIFDLDSLTTIDVSISGMTLAQGESALTDSDPRLGGAVYNSDNLTLINDAIVTGTAVGGGGVYNVGTLTSIGNTYSGNTAQASGGGGIENLGTVVSTNDTFAQNSLTVAAVHGAGILNGGTLTTINDTIAGNLGGGVDNLRTWNSLNTIVAGNQTSANSTTPSDVTNTLIVGTISASHTLVGDASSAGGIANGTNGNIVGAATSSVLVTDSNGKPLLANNGGPTQTIALPMGSPALGVGGMLTSTVTAVPQTTAATTIAVASTTFLSAGQFLRIDNEVVLVTLIVDATDVTVQRAQQGTTAASHLANAPLLLADDQSGALRARTDLGAFAAIDHAPAGTSRTVTTPENIPYSLKASDFGFSDPNDTPSNSFQAVKIPTLPNAGRLTDNGIPVTANQLVAATDINSGKLVFTPTSNLVGSYFLLRFQVQDDGGTANGGVNLDPIPKTLDVLLSPVNHAPVGTPGTVAMLENTGYTFRIGDFGLTDPNDFPHNSLLSVKITAPPALGTLKDNGITLAAPATISIADINAGKLRFTPATNVIGESYSSFQFRVQDNGGTANGGSDTDTTSRKMTLAVDSPLGTSSVVKTAPNTAYRLHTSDFGFADPAIAPANSQLAVQIVVLPNSGTLTDNGIAVTVGQFVSVADVSSGKLVFTPLSNLKGVYFLCIFQVYDVVNTHLNIVSLDPSGNVLDVRIGS